MLAFQNYKILRIIVFLSVALVTVAVVSAQDAKWKPCPPGTKLKVGDKVLVDTMRGWAEGTVVGFFGHTDMPNVQYTDPDFGSTTRPFRMEDIRIPAAPAKKNDRAVPRGKTGEGENPFEVPDQYREWSDSSGKFKIEAELVETRGGDVVLRKRDGKEVAVPIDRLSEADQKYLKSHESTQEEGGNPYEGAPNIVEPDWSEALGVLLGIDVPPDNLEPDAGPPAGALVEKSVTLPPKGSFFEKVSGIFPAVAEDGLCAVGVSCEFPDNKAYAGIFRCNLGEKGSKVDAIEIPDKSVPLDIGPHGDLLITRSSGRMSRDKGRLSMWKLDGKKCVKQWDCSPYSGQRNRFHTEVQWAKFLDEGHLLTLGGDSNLTLWKLPKMKAVYSVTLKSQLGSQFHGKSVPTLSPGRKYIALLGSGFVEVLNARTGDVVGTYKGAGKTGSIAFRPDGKRIALATPTRVQVWEFSTGEMYRDIGLSTPFSHLGSTAWPAPGYILIGGRFLIDLEHHALLWEYRPAKGTGSVELTEVIARRLWFMATLGDQRALVPFTVPHQAALEVIEKIRPEDTLVLQPGMQVGLDIQVEATPEEQQRVRDRFETNLKDNGFQIVESAPIRVVVKTERREVEQKEYEEAGPSPFPMPPFGGMRNRGGATQHGTFQGYVSSVTITIDGKDAWEVTSEKRAPTHVSLQEGESLDQALKRHEKVDLGFFERTVLPRYLCVPVNNYTFGATEMTPNGPQSAAPTSRKKPEKKPAVPQGNRA